MREWGDTVFFGITVLLNNIGLIFSKPMKTSLFPLLQHLPLAVSLALLLLLAGCSGKEKAEAEAPPPLPPPPPPAPVENPADIVWNEQPGGLNYRIEAAADLNTDKKRPLALTLCVYQLKDTAAFQALAAAPGGIDRLLNCTLDLDGARTSHAYQIQPGSKRTETLDRAAEARYLAAVAGYVHLKPELCTATLAFPVQTSTKGWIFKDTLYSAAPVQAFIHLGPQSLTLSETSSVR